MILSHLSSCFQKLHVAVMVRKLWWTHCTTPVQHLTTDIAREGITKTQTMNHSTSKVKLFCLDEAGFPQGMLLGLVTRFFLPAAQQPSLLWGGPIGGKWQMDGSFFGSWVQGNVVQNLIWEPFNGTYYSSTYKSLNTIHKYEIYKKSKEKGPIIS